MEGRIIFHFAGRGDPTARLALIDFAQLLNPRWQPPLEQFKPQQSATKNIFMTAAENIYNFMLGGLAGGFGATIVYPIDLGAVNFLARRF